jgi:hypothetical protein
MPIDVSATSYFKPEPLFDSMDLNSSLYRQITENVLDKILPNSFKLIEDRDSCLDKLHKLLPYVAVSDFSETVPFNLSFFLLCSFRPNAFQFFFEFVTRWLIPGKRLNVEVFFSSDFKFPNLSNESYTIAEVVIRVETREDLEVLKQHLPVIETELRLGIDSVYHARRIIEIKGMNHDTKTAMIHESIASLIKKGAGNVNWDILSQMQHFLVTCNDKFKSQREYRHMSRLICFLYLFRREMKNALKTERNKRLVYIRLVHTKLAVQDSVKNVLGVLVGINFLQDHEVFEERHLLKGLQSIIPSCRFIEGSFFCHTVPKEPIKNLYLEIEKSEGSFSKEEIIKLKKYLAADLRGRVEKLLHPIFMPRNEEEVMRNVVTLSNQIKFVRDIPQVILSFDEHTSSKLSFTVILTRVLKKGSLSIQELFHQSQTILRYTPERTKIVGYLRKKWPKEASIFHVSLEKSQFIREDHSVDLYKARQTVISELFSIFGDVRDFNGGMISKQNELLLDLKELLGGVAKHHELLLENFFYSLRPVVMRSLLEPLILKKLFLFLLDAIDDGIGLSERHLIKFWQEDEGLYVVVIARENTFQSDLFKSIEHLRTLGFNSAYVNVSVRDKNCFGFIYRGLESDNQARYYETIEDVLKSW